MRLKIPPGSKVAANFGDWTLYELPPRERDSFLWMKVKVMRPPNTAAKRGQNTAYWLSWSLADERFARAAVTQRFEAAQPDLFARVALHMSMNYSLDLYTPAEIAEERQRLAAVRKERRAS